MRIYVFRSQTGGNAAGYTYYKPEVYDALTGIIAKQDYFHVDQFGGKGEDIWGDSGEADEQHNYEIKPRLPIGYHYKFLAVGRDDIAEGEPEGQDVVLSFTSSWTEGHTTLEAASMRSSQIYVTELFSGYNDEDIYIGTDSKAFKTSIELQRAVAGILLYVKNVPKEIPAEITVEQDGETGTGIIIDDLIKQGSVYPVDYIGIAPVAHSDEVGLADKSSRGETILNEKKIEISGQYMTTSAVIPFADAYVMAERGKADAEGRLLAGNFVMPQRVYDKSLNVDSDQLSNTLYLVYYTGKVINGIKVPVPVRWRTIRCASDVHTDVYQFPLTANHFYSLGKKHSDIDEPVDLEEAGSEITIQIDPFWNEYYGGNIGEPWPGLGVDTEWGEHPGGELK